MVTVEFTPEAGEQFDRLPRAIKVRMEKLRTRLTRWPDVSGVKALSGNLAGWYRVRTGDYRMRFRFQEGKIIVDKIGHGSEFYED